MRLSQSSQSELKKRREGRRARHNIAWQRGRVFLEELVTRRFAVNLSASRDQQQ
jgi:hypothetical protein